MRAPTTGGSTRWNRTSDTTRSRAVAADLGHPDFPTLCAHLNRHGVEYVVLGGWACIAHGLSRTTMDVDIFIKPTEENAQRLIDASARAGFGTARDLEPRDILNRTVFIFKDQIRVDIFTHPWGLKDFEACRSRRAEFEFESIRISFVGIDDLIRSKRTDRPQDKQDAAELRRIKRDRRDR
jgi:hypothetical protein